MPALRQAAMVSLLDEAARCFETVDLLQEACTCNVLRSLLDLDLDRASAKTVPLLVASACLLDGAIPPGFAAWARTTAAWQLTEQGRNGVSRELLANSWRDWGLVGWKGGRGEVSVNTVKRRCASGRRLRSLRLGGVASSTRLPVGISPLKWLAEGHGEIWRTWGSDSRPNGLEREN